jgi:hypothetical protein
MTRKQLLSVAVLIVMGTVSTVVAQNSGSGAAQDYATIQQEIKESIRQRHAAYLRGDREAYRQYISDRCYFAGVGGVDTAAQQLESVKPAVGEKLGLELLGDVSVQVYGSTAIATYAQNKKHIYGSQTLNATVGVADTYIKKDGRWLLILHAEVSMPPKRTAAKVDPAIYKAYVGQYEWAPGYVDTVTLNGNKLMARITGEEKAVEFQPENETNFFIENDEDDGVTTFVKDTSGKVTHYVYRAHGQDIIGKKIK